MHTVKEKVSDAAGAGKAQIDIAKAKAEEKAEKAVARTKEEEQMAHEHRKAKEAEAQMKQHEAKAEHAAEKQTHSHHQPVGTGAPFPGGPTVPTYPLGGPYPPVQHNHKYV